MYKPLKASIFCCVLDTGLRWGVKSNTTYFFCLEIDVCQHFNTISTYILGVLQLALTWTRPMLEIPELQPLVLWIWLRLTASASVIYLFVSTNRIYREQQKRKESFLGWYTSLQTLWNGNTLYVTFLFNQPSVVPCKCIIGITTTSLRTFHVAHSIAVIV